MLKLNKNKRSNMKKWKYKTITQIELLI